MSITTISKEIGWQLLSLGLLLVLVGGFAYFVYGSIVDIYNHFINEEKEKVVFYRDQFSGFGGLLVSLALLVGHTYVLIKRKKLSKQVVRKFEKIMLAGLSLFLAMPIMAHIVYNARYEDNKAYYYCENESDIWLFSMTKVYVKDKDLCRVGEN